MDAQAEHLLARVAEHLRERRVAVHDAPVRSGHEPAVRILVEQLLSIAVVLVFSFVVTFAIANYDIDITVRRNGYGRQVDSFSARSDLGRLLRFALPLAAIGLPVAGSTDEGPVVPPHPPSRLVETTK